MENKKIGMIGILAVVLIAIGTAAFLNTERESNTTDEEGPTILTVEYNGNEKDFTMGELMDMEKTSIKTDDPHLGEEIEYIGVSLQTFRKELNIDCKGVKVIGNDGYNKTINAEDFGAGIVVSYRADGELISDGIGGPIKLSFSEEAKKIYDQKNWIWFIVKLEFR